jgi:lipopolysaccharide/colanic/teichoic acid biosynthesis glycosyltransferase
MSLSSLAPPRSERHFIARMASAPTLPSLPSIAESDPRYETSKREIDIMASLLLLILAAPVMLAIAVLVKLTSPGTVVFRQKRLGKGGRVFWCYKFRTMVADAEARLKRNPELRAQFEVNFKLKQDPRVTRLGAFLRKTSLDELPQLFNVLIGDMSLIGPRPIVQHELTKYGRDADKFLSVKPGLGGLWQVYGRSDTSYDSRVSMDLEYIDNRSTVLDLKLIVQTAAVVLSRRGAC